MSAGATDPSTGAVGAAPEKGRLVGMKIEDRYELVAELGQGGQSVVYRAHDHQSGRDVAVKLLVLDRARYREHAARLAREQEALVALAGTAAVGVYDLCRAPNGSLCLVMELLHGRDLEQVYEAQEAQGKTLPLPKLSLLFEPVVETLERAHDAGILHRDMKPANIFVLDGDAGVKLLDFGLSRARTATKLTVAGTILGSPSYIAPEAWKGKTEDLDARADVYSLGVVLFRGLTGRLPFESESLHGSFVMATTAPRPKIRALRPDLSADMDAWVERALAIDREARYADVRDLWKGLLSALSYVPPPRPFRPVAESLVNAWRSATSAFRRIVDGASFSGVAAPERTSGIVETAPPRVEKLQGAAPPPLGVRPAKRGAKPPPLPRQRAAKATDDEWVEIGDDEIEVASVRTMSPPSASATTPASGAAAAGVAAPSREPPREVSPPAGAPESGAERAKPRTKKQKAHGVDHEASSKPASVAKSRGKARGKKAKAAAKATTKAKSAQKTGAEKIVAAVPAAKRPAGQTRHEKRKGGTKRSR